ncbi:MAG: MarR family transcriptional regulator [Oscillospiraceae bacterium]|nr:MarR family transcriptional regulator [Oscillospiraceae bacterium]
MTPIDRQCSLGFTIRCLSNLMRRKLCESAPLSEGRSEVGGQIMGFLCDHADREFYQRDVEEIFYIRRSTASRFLKDLERDGLLLRQGVSQDGRLKRLIPTEKALAIHEELNRKALQVESILSNGLTPEEITQFVAIAQKIQQNLMR